MRLAEPVALSGRVYLSYPEHPFPVLFSPLYTEAERCQHFYLHDRALSYTKYIYYYQLDNSHVVSNESALLKNKLRCFVFSKITKIGFSPIYLYYYPIHLHIDELLDSIEILIVIDETHPHTMVLLLYLQ